MSIGDRICKLRKSKGFTQLDLANKLFITDKAISSWENNRTKPDIKSLCVLSETLNTTIDYLLYGNKTKEKDEIELNSETVHIVGQYAKKGFKKNELFSSISALPYVTEIVED